MTSFVSISIGTTAGAVRPTGGATCGTGSGPTFGAGWAVGPGAAAAGGMADMSCCMPGTPLAGAAFAAGAGWAGAPPEPTISLPTMPASLWPGIEQMNS